MTSRFHATLGLPDWINSNYCVEANQNRWHTFHTHILNVETTIYNNLIHTKLMPTLESLSWNKPVKHLYSDIWNKEHYIPKKQSRSSNFQISTKSYVAQENVWNSAWYIWETLSQLITINLIGGSKIKIRNHFWMTFIIFGGLWKTPFFCGNEWLTAHAAKNRPAALIIVSYLDYSFWQRVHAKSHFWKGSITERILHLLSVKQWKVSANYSTKFYWQTQWFAVPIIKP